MTKAVTALVIIALLVGASGAYVNLSLQASLSQLRSEAAGLSDSLSRLYQALGLQGAEQAKILSEARKEGKVVVYGSIDQEVMKPTIEAFERLYPFLKVEYWRASSSGVFDRVITEVKAGNPRFDVVMTSPFLLDVVKREGGFQKYVAPEATKYPTEFQSDPDGVISPFITLRPIGIVYNKQLLSPAEAPKSLNDLLDPKWKGKIVIPDPTQHATTVDWLYSLRRTFQSDPDWEAWIRGLGKNDPLLVKSFIPAVETVIRGEKPMAITYFKYVFIYSKAPLDYVRISPSLGNVNSLALGAKAEHPAAAKLFVSFMLSNEALRVMAGAGENVSMEGIYPPIQDIEKIKVIPVKELSVEDFKKWAKTFNGWLTGG